MDKFGCYKPIKKILKIVMKAVKIKKAGGEKTSIVISASPVIRHWLIIIRYSLFVIGS